MMSGSFASPNEPTKRKKAPIRIRLVTRSSENQVMMVSSLDDVAAQEVFAERHGREEPDHRE